MVQSGQKTENEPVASKKQLLPAIEGTHFLPFFKKEGIPCTIMTKIFFSEYGISLKELLHIMLLSVVWQPSFQL